MVEKIQGRVMRASISLCLLMFFMVQMTSHNHNRIEYFNNVTPPTPAQPESNSRDRKGYLISDDTEDRRKSPRALDTHCGAQYDAAVETTESYLLIQSLSNQLITIQLISNKEFRDIPFDFMFGQMEVVTGKESKHSVTINHTPTRTMNYTFGLGVNYVDVGLSSGELSSKHHLISINRLPRPVGKLTTPENTCYLEQDCSLRVYDNLTTCGLVTSYSNSWSPRRGYWKLKCESCNEERMCNWESATWFPDRSSRPSGKPDDSQLQTCLANKQLLFLGDSTNRGIMQSLMERVNGSLTAAEKSHTSLSYSGLGKNTTFTFTYYPAFWLKEWPTFVQALYKLPEISSYHQQQLGGSTYLVVGGVQWLTISQLQQVSKFAQRMQIPASHVIVKTHSSGFLYPVNNVPYAHTQESLKTVIHQNDMLVKEAEERGFTVLNTLQMTLSRYKEFLQGKCACHFHEVSEYGDVELRSQGSLSKLYKLGLVERHPSKPSLYHVSGPVHDTYTDMLVNSICS